MTIVKFYNSFVKIFSSKQKKEIYILLFLSIIAMILETLGIASILPLLDYIFGGSLENQGYFFLNNDFLNIKNENILLFFIILFILIFGFIYFIHSILISIYFYLYYYIPINNLMIYYLLSDIPNSNN